MKKYRIRFMPALSMCEIQAKNEKEAAEIAWDNFDELAQIGMGDVSMDIQELDKNGNEKRADGALY